MTAEVSIVVVPRERYSCARPSLESLYQTTAVPFELVYVDGGSPPYLRDYLRTQADARGFKLLRDEELPGSNRARNTGLRETTGRFVVFLDNDVVFRPLWLEALLHCAAETGADVVNPLHFIGELEQQIVHFAGSTLQLEQRGDVRQLRETHLHVNQPYAAVRPLLQRGRSDIAEFHCVLVRRALLERIGGFDDGMLNLAEHLDFSLAVREGGGSIWVEPAAQVSYLATRESVLSDVRCFMRRWNDDWSRRTLDHFTRKWRLDPDCKTVREQAGFAANHRLTVGVPFVHGGGNAVAAAPAQTNLQLYRQCVGLGYLEHDLAILRRAYEQAQEWFGHLYRASGRPFLAHLCGTASLLAVHGAPFRLVLAGLLHPLYEHVLPDPQAGRITLAQRQTLLAFLGPDLEKILHASAAFDWVNDDPQRLLAGLAQLPLTTAQVLLLRLAGDLEEQHERCLQYSAKQALQTRRWLPLYRAVAAELGLNAMADQLQNLLEGDAAAPAPAVLRSSHERFYSMRRPVPRPAG